MNERGGGVAPDLCLGLIICFQIPFPDSIAGSGVEAEQSPFRAETVDEVSVNRWRGPGAGGVTDAVAGGIAVFPEHPAGRLAEAEDSS